MKGMSFVSLSLIALGSAAAGAATEQVSIHALPQGEIAYLYESVGGAGARERAAMIDFIVSQARQPKSTMVADADLKSRLSEISELQARSKAREPSTPAGRAEPSPPPAQVAPSALVKCTLQNPGMGVLHTSKKEVISAYYYSCPDGDVFIRALSLSRTQHRTIKELSNVKVGDAYGYLYESRDDKGNVFTRLTWATSDTHFLVDKAGRSSDVHDWLVDYAQATVR